MSNGNAGDATLTIREFLKWTTLPNHPEVVTIMDQAIKQGFLNGWLMNWVKPIHKCGYKNLVSNYWIVMVNSFMTKLNNTSYGTKV